MLICATLAVMAASHASQESISPRLLRFPTIHGSTVVFSESGDLWSADLSGGLARRLTTGPGQKLYPAFSPDGNTLAFTGFYDGAPNVYTIPATGGVPNRLTYDAVADIVFGWAPGGKIAYGTPASTETLGRQADLYLINSKGGLPERTALREVGFLSYFGNENRIAYSRQRSFNFNWRRYRGGSQGFVSFYNFQTGAYSELPHGREQQFYPMAVGDSVYYASDKGDGVLNLYVTDLKTKRQTKLTHFDGEDIKWANTDGHKIALQEDGFIWIYDIASAKLTKFDPQIASDDLQSRPALKNLARYVSNISISPSGARVAVDARGSIFTIPEKNGVTRQLASKSGVRMQAPAWSPDGQSIAYLSDATGETEIYVKPQMGGDATKLTSIGKTISDFSWFPDGKQILIRTVDNHVEKLNVATKQVTDILTAPSGIASLDISPDSNWLAYVQVKPIGTSELWLLNLNSMAKTKVTSGQFQEGDVAFDLNGKFLYLNSARSFTPTPGLFGPSLKVTDAQRIYMIPLQKSTDDPFLPADDEEPKVGAPAAPPSGPPAPPIGAPSGHPGPARPRAPIAPKVPSMMVDTDGIGDRMVPLPMPSSNYGGLIGLDNGILYSSNGTIFRFTLSAKAPEPVLSGPVARYDVNPSRTKLAYIGGGGIGEVPLMAPSHVGQGTLDESGLQETIDPVAEWKQIFWEAWRFERDHYYDANFRGQNWKAIGDHYAEYLPFVHSRDDLNIVLGLLISELGTSHSYVTAPGDVGNLPRPEPIGYLGADYVSDHGKIRLKKVFRGNVDTEEFAAPLARPGMNIADGDYLLSIDGQPVGPNDNPASFLVGKVGHLVEITVNNRPDTVGARTLRVMPVSNEIPLRYAEFVRRSKALVDKLTGGRIGYMHIRDTAAPGSEDFARGFWGQTDKDAMIIDERWNGGGYPSPGFVSELAKKIISMGQSRNGEDAPIHFAMSGPQAMLINGYAGSGGDLFPWTFRYEKLGPLIGMRTWGGLVGISSGAPLVDGGSVTAPSFSLYDPATGEIIAENHGIDPDIQVDDRPDLVAKGEDVQLKAAIDYLLKELDRRGPAAKRKLLPKLNKDGLNSLPPTSPR